MLVIVVLIFGTKRLKSIGSDLGGAIKGFKKSMDTDEDKPSEEPQKRIESEEDDAEFPERKKEQEPQCLALGCHDVRHRFLELVLVAIIGLLVFGPQRLPKVAAEIGKWVGRARRTATQLRRQLEREIELSEIEKPPPPPSPPRLRHRRRRQRRRHRLPRAAGRGTAEVRDPRRPA